MAFTFQLAGSGVGEKLLNGGLRAQFVSAGRFIQLLSRDTSFIQGFHKKPCYVCCSEGSGLLGTAKAWALVVSVVF